MDWFEICALSFSNQFASQRERQSYWEAGGLQGWTRITCPLHRAGLAQPRTAVPLNPHNEDTLPCQTELEVSYLESNWALSPSPLGPQRQEHFSLSPSVIQLPLFPHSPVTRVPVGSSAACCLSYDAWALVPLLPCHLLLSGTCGVARAMLGLTHTQRYTHTHRSTLLGAETGWDLGDSTHVALLMLLPPAGHDCQDRAEAGRVSPSAVHCHCTQWWSAHHAGPGRKATSYIQ